MCLCTTITRAVLPALMLGLIVSGTAGEVRAAPPPLDVMKDLAASRPPSWIKWLGWANDGSRIAWREGPHGTGNVPGKPVWIARLNPEGAIVDRHYRRTQLQKALDSRGIRRRPQALLEALGPRDVLIRTRAGEVLAVAVRGNPPILAVLRRVDGDYKVIARQQVMGPVRTVRVNASESPGGRLLAVVAHTGRAKRRQGSIFIVPLQPAAQRRALRLPAAVTPDVAAAAPSRQAPTAPPKATRPAQPAPSSPSPSKDKPRAAKQ